jgi:GntR family transcriptional regulator
MIEAKYRLPIVCADEEISARGAAGDAARHLRVPRGSTVLVMQRLTYTSLDRPLEFVQAIYRPEHCAFAVRLRR